MCMGWACQEYYASRSIVQNWHGPLADESDTQQGNMLIYETQFAITGAGSLVHATPLFQRQ